MSGPWSIVMGHVCQRGLYRARSERGCGLGPGQNRAGLDVTRSLSPSPVSRSHKSTSIFVFLRLQFPASQAGPPCALLEPWSFSASSGSWGSAMKRLADQPGQQPPAPGAI